MPDSVTLDVLVVDLGEKEGLSANENEERVAKQLMEGITKNGSVHLTNHGIPQDKIQNVMALSKAFFDLPLDIKNKFAGQMNICGYQRLGLQVLEGSNPPDLVEAWQDRRKPEMVYPDEKVPELKPALQEFHDLCEKLTSKVFRSIATSLGLKDREFFNKAHKNPRTTHYPCLKSCMYPAISEPYATLPENQQRCALHSDWGTITFVFQDETGGLETKLEDGRFAKVPPKDGAVVLHMADMIQRWTADKIKTTPHRVALPDEANCTRHRQSIVYFVFPDNDTVVEQIDGSKKYSPINIVDYFNEKLKNNFY